VFQAETERSMAQKYHELHHLVVLRFPQMTAVSDDDYSSIFSLHFEDPIDPFHVSVFITNGFDAAAGD